MKVVFFELEANPGGNGGNGQYALSQGRIDLHPLYGPR